MKNRKLIYMCVVVIMLLIGVISFFVVQPIKPTSPTIFILKIIWIISFITLYIKIVFTITGFRAKDFKKHSIETKKVIAIIPTFNEEEYILMATIEAILNQTYDVTHIYVIDDGSYTPLAVYDHPKITWLRQANKGKRYAQVHGILSIKEDVDYILTVDSDSIIEKQAVEKMIYQFSQDPELQGLTGLVLTNNFRENLMTRIVDLNTSISCVISRPIRSFFGALETTSGALSLYKKELFFNNLNDYLTSGTYSDDRQLCYYGLLRGNVTAATDIIVHSYMPKTFKDTVSQRLRWAKGSWVFFPKQMKNLTIRKKIFPIISMIQVISILPLFILFLYYMVVGNYFPVVCYFVIRLSVRYCESALYIFQENRMGILEKGVTWLILTPLELIFSLFLLSYVKYHALFLLHKDDWITR